MKGSERWSRDRKEEETEKWQGIQGERQEVWGRDGH